MKQSMRIDKWTNPESEYTKAIDNATSCKELIKAIEPYRLVAEDAYQTARLLTEKEYHEFLFGLNKERNQISAGEEWIQTYSHIAMPRSMGAISWVANIFKLRDIHIQRETHTHTC